MAENPLLDYIEKDLENGRVFRNRFVSGVIRKYNFSEQTAEEIFQELYLKASLKYKTYDPERKSVEQYLMVMGGNLCVDYFRERGTNTCNLEKNKDYGRVSFLRGNSAMKGPLEELIDEENKKRVRVALGRLNEKNKRIIEEAYFRGMTYREIASAESIPLGTVKSRLYEAVRKLREELEIE